LGRFTRSQARARPRAEGREPRVESPKPIPERRRARSRLPSSMDRLAGDIRYAFRLLVRNPGFSAVAIAALAIGIGANTAIFSVVNGVLLQPLPYPHAERLVRICREFPSGMGCAQSIPKFMAWRPAGAFDAVAAYDFAGPGINLSGGDRPQQVRGIHVSADY